MKPDDSYKKLQKRLWNLIKINDLTGERTKVENQLEKKFMAAWQFAPDRLRLGSKLANAIRLFRTNKDDNRVRGLDHCTHYTGENDQRILVTQPYGSLPLEIAQDLTLHTGIRLEVIVATEWAFHNPDANLFILKFPAHFQKSMQDFEKKLERAKIEENFKPEEIGSHDFDFVEVS